MKIDTDINSEDGLDVHEKRETFLTRLAALGYAVTPIKDRPRIYSINGKRVNVRSTRMQREDRTGSRRFWYNVSLNVLTEVDHVIYLTTEPDYFMMLPSAFLSGLVDRMYEAEDNPATRVFDIDWDQLTLVLSKGQEASVSTYYGNLLHPEDLPNL